MRKRFLPARAASASVWLFLVLFLFSGALAEPYGTCGENLSWAYDTASHTLTISGTGGMDDYEGMGAPWYDEYGNDMRTVIIEPGATRIGVYAFMFCDVETVSIPDTVTAIADYAFYDCYHLKSVYIPDSVLSIGRYAFRYCDEITSIHLPDGLTAISEGTFLGCSGLKSIEIPDTVTAIGKLALSGCTGLTELTIPDSVETLGEFAFSSCKGLTSITVPGSITFVSDNAFANCTGLKEVTLEEGVGIIGSSTDCPCSVFSDCYQLETVRLPSSLRGIGWASFYNCNSLKRIVIPDGVLVIAAGAFMNCANLVDVTIPPSVTSLGTRVFGTEPNPDLTVQCVSGSKAAEYAEAYGIQTSVMPSGSCGNGVNWVLVGDTLTISGTGSTDDFDPPSSPAPWYESRDAIRAVIVKDGVTGIGSGAFASCAGLTTAAMPDSVTGIGENAFTDCAQATVVSSMEAYAKTYAEENDILWQHDRHTLETIPGTKATCESTGLSKGSRCTVCEAIVREQKEIPALGHVWSRPIYVWAENGAAVTGTVVCQRDHTHTKEETVPAHGRIIVSPTDTQEGSYDLTSEAFELEAFSVQSKAGATIPALNDMTVLRLPDKLTAVESGAFAGVSCEAVLLPEGCLSVGEGAFAGCPNLLYVRLPSSVALETGAFDEGRLILFDATEN